MKNVSKANKQRGMAMQLQRFAVTHTTPTTPGSNKATNTTGVVGSIGVYRPQFVRALSLLFQKRSYFANFFDGGIATQDDIAENDTVFTLKINQQPVVAKRYDIDPNKAFGTGTANSTRFGDRTEIVYKTVAVPYTWDYGWHEGIDRATVNMDEATAIADRIKAQAEFKMSQFNKAHGKFISDNATALTNSTVAGANPTQAEVVAAFNEAFELFTNLEAIGTKRAYVTPEVWNLIVDSGLAVNDAKAAGVNVATNYIYSFKEFILELTPKSVMGGANDLIYFTIDRAAMAFTGVATARTIESEDFDGKAFQGRGRAGEYILDDNKQVVKKLVATP